MCAANIVVALSVPADFLCNFNTDALRQLSTFCVLLQICPLLGQRDYELCRCPEKLHSRGGNTQAKMIMLINCEVESVWSITQPR